MLEVRPEDEMRFWHSILTMRDLIKKYGRDGLRDSYVAYCSMLEGDIRAFEKAAFALAIDFRFFIF